MVGSLISNILPPLFFLSKKEKIDRVESGLAKGGGIWLEQAVTSLVKRERKKRKY